MQAVSGETAARLTGTGPVAPHQQHTVRGFATSIGWRSVPSLKSCTSVTPLSRVSASDVPGKAAKPRDL